MDKVNEGYEDLSRMSEELRGCMKIYEDLWGFTRCKRISRGCMIIFLGDVQEYKNILN